jgi:hypothetical protein
MPKNRTQTRGRGQATDRPATETPDAPLSAGEACVPSTAHRVQPPDTALEPSRAVSVDEASACFPEDWILMRITGWNDENVPAGEVLLHSSSRAEISKAVRLARKRHPRVHLATFHGGMRRLASDELRAGLNQVARGPYVNAAW